MPNAPGGKPIPEVDTGPDPDKDGVEQKDGSLEQQDNVELKDNNTEPQFQIFVNQSGTKTQIRAQLIEGVETSENAEDLLSKLNESLS